MEKIFKKFSNSISVEIISGFFGRLLYACMGIIAYYMYIHKDNLQIHTMVSDLYWVLICGMGFALSAFLINGTTFIEKRSMIKPYVVSSLCWFCLYGWFAYWLAGQC